jgi:glycosyltransferase involved in cell wall biosynthesis
VRVFAVASYPVEAAASRYRIIQFIPYLKKHGIDVEFSPFIGSAGFAHLYERRAALKTSLRVGAACFRRLREMLTRARRADAIFIQREAMLFGPPIFERYVARRAPIVLDLDDPTYLGTVNSVYGKVVAAIRWQRKGEELIRLATIVLCGNETIAEYVRSYGIEARIVPTVVDLDVFRPRDTPPAGIPVLGWIGTQATYPYLEALFPVLRRLREKHEFQLRIVGSGRPAPDLGRLEVRHDEWALERETEDFRTIDVGLYPLWDEPYARGKSGFKAIQFMGVGIPFVTAPVGICATIGEAGRTHHLASSEDDWYAALDELLSNPKLRQEMGARGRQHALAHYTVEKQGELIAAALRDAMHVWNRRRSSAA